MSWSYSLDLLATSPLMQVRFLIGDTNVNSQLLQDEEIEYLLDTSAGSYFAAARACDTIVSKYSGSVSKTVGPLTVNLGDRATNYATLAKRLRAQANREGGTTVDWGGNSEAAKDSVALDTDKIGTAARIGGMDFPYSNSGYNDRVDYHG